VTESASLECQTCGPAPVPDGTDPFQIAIAHANVQRHTVKVIRIDIIGPEENP